MSEQTVVHLAVQALVVTAKIAVPVLGASLLVGLVVSLFQAMTQINDFTFTFIPKLVAIVAVFVIAGHWMLGQFTAYTETLYRELPRLVSQG
jgi:flagellar biosynthetic protein FliQ